MKDKRFKHIVFDPEKVNSDLVVSDYFKLKFKDCELTDYEFLLWVKLFYYMKHKEETSAQDPSPELLDALRREYNPPKPTNDLDSQTLFDKMIKHEWIKIQDNTGKYLFGPFSKTEWNVPSFSINRFQRSLNITIGFLRKQLDSGGITGELKEKIRWMIDCIYGINHFVSLFISSEYIREEKEEPTGNMLKMSFPYSGYKTVCQQIYEIIMAFCDIPKTDWEADGFEDVMRMPLILPKIIELKGIAGFSCLSGFFVDAMFFSFDFAKSLMNILLFFQINFHNSLLWRIEFAASPVNLGTPVEQRGQQDHTTQLKVFLFDSKDRPRVIRIDMPHKGERGEQHLHFNVKPIFDSESYDHQIISRDCDQIQSVLESVREAMTRECPNLYEIKDSDADSDDSVLAEMERFLVYEDMTTKYFIHEKDEALLEHYNTLSQTNCSSMKDALEDAYLSFYNRF